MSQLPSPVMLDPLPPSMEKAMAQGKTKWTNCDLAWGPWRGRVLQPVAPKAWQPQQGQAVAQAGQSQGQKPTGSSTGCGNERNLLGFTVDEEGLLNGRSLGGG